MGADFLLSWVRSPGHCSLEDVEKAATLLTAELSFDDLLGLFDQTFNVGMETWEDTVPKDAWPDDGNIEDVPRDIATAAGRETMKGLIVAAAKAIYFTGRRDTAAVSLPCECGCGHVNKYIFSGDMSWGDEPDAFHHLEILGWFDVAETIKKSDLQHLADTACEVSR